MMNATELLKETAYNLAIAECIIELQEMLIDGLIENDVFEGICDRLNRKILK